MQGPTTGSRVRVWAFCVACSWLMPTAHNQDPETCAWHSRILCVDRRSKNKTRMCFSLESLKTLLRITQWYQLLRYIIVSFLDLTVIARFRGLKNFLLIMIFLMIFFNDEVNFAKNYIQWVFIGRFFFFWDKIDLWFTDFYVIIFIIIYIIACL